MQCSLKRVNVGLGGVISPHPTRGDLVVVFLICSWISGVATFGKLVEINKRIPLLHYARNIFWDSLCSCTVYDFVLFLLNVSNSCIAFATCDLLTVLLTLACDTV